MSRTNDERTLQDLKFRLKMLELDKEAAIKFRTEMAIADAKARHEMSDIEYLAHKHVQESMQPHYFTTDEYDRMIDDCQREIRVMEQRLSHSEAHNFISDALNTAGSVQHVQGRVYSYNDKNDGCSKFIVLFLVFDVIVVLIIVALTGGF